MLQQILEKPSKLKFCFGLFMERNKGQGGKEGQGKRERDRSRRKREGGWEEVCDFVRNVFWFIYDVSYKPTALGNICPF